MKFVFVILMAMQSLRIRTKMGITNKLMNFVDRHGMTIAMVGFLIGMAAIGYAKYASLA